MIEPCSGRSGYESFFSRLLILKLEYFNQTDSGSADAGEMNRVGARV